MSLLSSEQRTLEAFKLLDPISMTRTLAQWTADPKVGGPLISACRAVFNGTAEPVSGLKATFDRDLASWPKNRWEKRGR